VGKAARPCSSLTSSLVPRLIMRGALHSLPNTSSWHGTQLNTRTTLP